MNVGENELCELVWRECVQRAFDVGIKLINKVKLLFYENLEKSRIEIEQVVLVT